MIMSEITETTLITHIKSSGVQGSRPTSVRRLAVRTPIRQRNMRLLKRTLLIAGLIASLHFDGSQGFAATTQLTQANDTQTMMEAIASVPPLPATATPEFGNFYTIQNGENWPPLPANTMNLPFWNLGDGVYLLDDRNVDYEAIQAEAEAEALLSAQLGAPMSMMASSLLNNAVAYGNGVYLTNMAAVFDGSAMVSSFSIAGGTNNIPYDILMSTNVADPVSQWAWLGIGYTSNSYAFSNQPLDQAFYILAKPQQTMVVGFGNDVVGQCDVPAGITNALMVAGGGGQSLALFSDGTVVAWGQIAYGQGSVPADLAGVTMISAGWFHDVALLTNGTVTAWGLNWHGMYNLTEVPSDLTNATVISAQALHSLALRNDGTVTAWGYGPDGEASVPSDLSNVVAIAAGYQFNVAAKADGTVTAWGNNSYAQCNVPAGLSNVVDVSAGPYHSLALLNDGTVVAWGDGSDGETNVPAGLMNVVAIIASGDPGTDSAYSLALKSDGTVVAWGEGEPAAPVWGMSNVIAIGAGADHALAIRTGPRTPVITLTPTDQYQIAGGNVTFPARGSGLYGVTYQWQANGVNISGETNATLTLTNVQAQGYYNVVVANEVGSIVSPNANLYLVTAPIVVSQSPMPTNQVVSYQHNLTLSVVASAPGQFSGFPLSYQWQLNGNNISGARSSSYTLSATGTGAEGIYSVILSNAVGTATASWQVTITYEGSYIAPGTLAYHLSTNAVGHANGLTGTFSDMCPLSGWTSDTYSGANLAHLTNSVWSTNFWLAGVQGLSATCIGYSNGTAATFLITMISPRHFLYAHHVGWAGSLYAFLDTNNVIYWRSPVQGVQIGDSDTSVGIMNADLPPSVGFLPVLPTNCTNYLPSDGLSYVQGIGMNQDNKIFGQPTTFSPISVSWNPAATAPFGLGTNWNVALRGGDSSDPERLLIGNQLVLTTQHFHATDGPNLVSQFDAINQQMHYLSTNNNVGTDYQLTTFSLTNWPTIH